MTTNRIEVPGVILCGGRSRRMFAETSNGGDKSLLDLAGKPILGHVIDRLAPQVSRLALIANGDPERFRPFGLPVVTDAGEAYAGPLAGLLAGLRWSAEVAPRAWWLATVPADTPFLPEHLIAALGSAAEGRPRAIALATSGGRTHPVVGVWPLALADDLAASLDRGDRKVMAWVSRHDTIAVEFPLIEAGGRVIDPFFNVNTPEDLAEARHVLGPRVLATRS